MAPWQLLADQLWRNVPDPLPRAYPCHWPALSPCLRGISISKGNVLDVDLRVQLGKDLPLLPPPTVGQIVCTNQQQNLRQHLCMVLLPPLAVMHLPLTQG